MLAGRFVLRTPKSPAIGASETRSPINHLIIRGPLTHLKWVIAQPRKLSGLDVFGVFRRMARQSEITEIRTARTCPRFESGDPAMAGPHSKGTAISKTSVFAFGGCVLVVLGAELDATTHV